MSNSQTKGILLTLTAAFISGISIFINKFAVDAINQPLIFTSIKNTGVTLIVLGLLYHSDKLKKYKELSRREIKYLLLIGIIGGSIPFYLFFTGLSLIPSINGAIIHKTLVLWVAILAAPFLKERLSIAGWFAVIVLFISNVLVGGFNGFEFSKGEFFVLAATVFWAIETILVKIIVPKINPEMLLGARMGIGAILLLLMSAYLYPTELAGVILLSPDKLIWIFATMVPLLLYFVFWYRGLRLIAATTATAILVVATLITNALSAIFITHTFNAVLIIQSALVVSGIYIIYKLERSAPTDIQKVSLLK